MSVAVVDEGRHGLGKSSAGRLAGGVEIRIATSVWGMSRRLRRMFTLGGPAFKGHR